VPVGRRGGRGSRERVRRRRRVRRRCRRARGLSDGALLRCRWTDITATTALASRLLQALGYRTVTQILSIPVTYASIKNRQIDVYLGDWQPSMEEDRKPFLADGSVQVGAGESRRREVHPGVPSYVAAAGVRSFADLRAHAERFHRKIFGIEPGNNGNRMIGSIIGQKPVWLRDWTLVESSEQGMLSEVDRAIRKSD